jgi:small-conductance mechanosensitive channel
MDWMSDAAMDSLRAVRAALSEPLFSVGDTAFSAAGVLKLLFFLVVLGVVAKLVRRALAERILPRARLDVGPANAIAGIVFYVLLTLGAMVGFQVSGIDLSTLTVLLGAVGVGIGFGLQTIASNFISGLIILFEQPVRVGDRIQIGPLTGRVARIRARATDIVTNDDIYVIVPNQELINQQVINWSQGEKRIRIPVPIGVAYGSDVEQVRDVLLGAAAGVDGMLQEPPPVVRLKGFADSAIEFEVLGWTSELLQAPGEFISRVNFAVSAALKRHGIEIPFPQRDLHLKSAVPLPVVMRSGDGA